MFNIGGGEMLMLAVLALLVFGPHGLPEIAAKVAKILKTVRRTADEFQREIQTALQEENRAKDEVKRRRKRPLAEEVEPTEVRELDAAEETAAAMLSEVPEDSAEPAPELPEGTHQVIDPALESAPVTPGEGEAHSPGESPTEQEAPEAAEPDLDDDGPQVPMRPPARPAPAPAQDAQSVSEADDGSAQMEDS